MGETRQEEVKSIFVCETLMHTHTKQTELISWTEVELNTRPLLGGLKMPKLGINVKIYKMLKLHSPNKMN